MTASTKKPVRHLAAPASLGERLYRLRYTIARRLVQLSVLALFVGTARLGWTLFGKPLLAGDFSASLLLGAIPLTDPFAMLQKLAAGHAPEFAMMAGAVVTLTIYLIAGGRAFCAWMCPMNIVTDAADSLRGLLGIRSDWIRLNPRLRYAAALGALAASAASGTAAFEWVSPQAFLWRDACWGLGLGTLSAVLGVFAFDLLLVRRGWCGHLCPLGGFWSAVGRFGVIKPLFASDRCTRCGDCLKVCPEPQVMNLNRAAARGMVADGECLNCARCIAICPENALSFGPRFKARATADADNSQQNSGE